MNQDKIDKFGGKITIVEKNKKNNRIVHKSLFVFKKLFIFA